MSLDVATAAQEPIGDVSELVDTFRSAERPTGRLLLGLEHERLMFPAGSAAPVPYDGPSGIGAVMQGFARFGFTEFRERPGAPVIAMQREKETLSLEPGGQFELSGSPFESASAANVELQRHAKELREVAASLGLRAVGLGYRPFTALADMPWMPKSRYRLMRETLGARGAMAHDMMLMTATGQVSLDWRDEADCVQKVEAAVRVSPLLVALYAKSPIAQGKPTGFQSFRSRVWNDVDPARCGYPQAMLDGSFSYRAYVEWALDAPLLFLRRDGDYRSPNMTFRQLLAQGFEGTRATHSDWTDHLSTLFPEVRLKKSVEIRSADGNGTEMTAALGAVMRGVLYDAQARDEATRLIPRQTPDAHRALHRAAQKDGLQAAVGQATLADFATDFVEIAAGGLARLGGLDDVALLDPLREIAAKRRSPAVDVLEHFAAEKRPEVFLSRYEI